MSSSGRSDASAAGMFSSPTWLWLLVVVAALCGGYWWVVRRRRTYVMRFTNLALLDRVAPRTPGRWRHVPVALVLAALAVMTIALAGPQAVAQVPRNRATVVVVIDVSLSMEATDVVPSRLRVAQDAAVRFADQLTPGINLGLISFAGSAIALVAPTRDRETFKRAVRNLQLAESTATGDAILTALTTIRSFAGQVPGPDGPPPSRIILLSDGKQTVPSTSPADPPRGAFVAADRARAENVPISAVSFGTQYGTIDIEGREVPVPAADDDMREIANRSRGQFFQASSDTDLRASYDALASQIGYEPATVDRSKPWLIGAFALIISALGVSYVLGQRLP